MDLSLLVEGLNPVLRLRRLLLASHWEVVRELVLTVPV